MLKKTKVIQGVVMLILIATIAGSYTFLQSENCNMLGGFGCDGYADEREQSDEIVEEILDLTAAPEQHDAEYWEARAAVERDIRRRELEALEQGRNPEESLERATQKALELREEKLPE